jgi:flagella basal body P-ring formation protein FlgA
MNAARGRPRSRSLLLLAALLVLGFALATAYLVTRAGDKVSVLSVGTPVTKGHLIERADLVSLSVAGITGAVPVERANQMVGKTATVDLVQGQVLTEDMVTTTPITVTGQSTVGLALDPTRVPSSGLDPGDIVDVIAVPNTEAGSSGEGGRRATSLDNPSVLARVATVYAAQGLAPTAGRSC